MRVWLSDVSFGTGVESFCKRPDVAIFVSAILLYLQVLMATASNGMGPVMLQQGAYDISKTNF